MRQIKEYILTPIITIVENQISKKFNLKIRGNLIENERGFRDNIRKIIDRYQRIEKHINKLKEIKEQNNKPEIKEFIESILSRYSKVKISNSTIIDLNYLKYIIDFYEKKLHNLKKIISQSDYERLQTKLNFIKRNYETIQEETKKVEIKLKRQFKELLDKTK